MGASRGIFIIFVPIPVVYAWLFIVQSGCVSIAYFVSCKKSSQAADGGQIACEIDEAGNVLNLEIKGIHYFLQLMPVLDIVSTILVLRNTNR